MNLLDGEVSGASQLLGLAIADEGREPFASAAFAAEEGVELTVHTRSVAGVQITEIEKGAVGRARTGRGYSLVATSARIDAVAERFESVLDRLLDVAALELSVRAGFAGTVVTDLPRLRRLLKRHDPHVYPGTYVTCVFNPDKALCRPHTDGTGVTRPVPADCQPLECRNVAVTAANADALRAEADRLADEAARRPTLPPLLLADLATRQRKITALLQTTPES